MTTNTVKVGRVELTRVGYADVTIPPEPAGLTAEDIARVPWAEPIWAQGDQLRAGAAVWMIQSGDARIAVDPAQAADEILRNDTDAAAHQEAFASLLADAGFPRESITHVISTHVEGIGMTGWRNDDGSWSPFFPDASIFVSARELAAIDDGSWVGDTSGAFEQLRAHGAVEALQGDFVRITDEVAVEFTGAHSPGHQIVRISSDGEEAVMVGHLAVSAVHFGTGECPPEHPDPAAAEAVLESLRASGVIVIGPLWPAPGAARWDGKQLVAVSG